MATFDDNFAALEKARDTYLEKLAHAQALEGRELAVAIAELRDIARDANERLGDFSRDLGLGQAIETESLLMLELTKQGRP